MEQVVRAVAHNVRALRERRGLSLGELAAASGVGKGTLSRIETAQANPTVETLFALADALGVTFGTLTAESTPSVQRVRAHDLPRIGGVVDARVVAHVAGAAQVEALDIVFSPGRTRQSSPHPAGVIEHLILLDGRLRAGPIGALADLDAGDVLRFAADVPHEYAALGEAPARAVVLMAYPRS